MTAYELELKARGFLPINPSSMMMTAGAQATFRDAAIPTIKPYPSAQVVYAPQWALDIYQNYKGSLHKTVVLTFCHQNERARGIAVVLLQSCGWRAMSDFLEGIIR